MKYSPLVPLLVAAFSTLAFGQADSPADKTPAPEKKPADQKEPSKNDTEPPKAEKPVEHSGKVTLGGREVRYIAQTGMVPILKDDGTPDANVFYVYYAVVDESGKRLAAKDAGSRPVTFCFNGGPGASAVWLHLGGLGPRRLDFPPDGLTDTTVSKVVDNPNSILDGTDLVFVDPVGTGLSRATKEENAGHFYAVEEDLHAAGEFVRLFTTREQRWGSPKFLCGESYGGTRVSGLSQYLQEKHGLYADGVILMSGVLNFQTIFANTGSDLPYILSLPAMTAVAHYHKKLPPDMQSDVAKAVEESRAFARGEYAAALLQGDLLPDDQRRAIAAKLARFTGLDAQEIDDQDLRVDSWFFRRMLLHKDGKILGAFDGRVTAEDGERSRTPPEFDPALMNVIGGISSAVNAYVRDELGYKSDNPYNVLEHLPWKWSGFEGRYVSVEDKLAQAMKTNPKLRVLVLTGDSDLVVPADSVPFSLAHVTLPQSLRDHINFQHYQSGHMMYLFRSDAEKLRGDLLGFLKE